MYCIAGKKIGPTAHLHTSLPISVYLEGFAFENRYNSAVLHLSTHYKGVILSYAVEGPREYSFHPQNLTLFNQRFWYPSPAARVRRFAQHDVFAAIFKGKNPIRNAYGICPGWNKAGRWP